MIEAAQKAKVLDPFLRAKAEKIQRKRGASVATAAIARHLLVAVYHILKEKTPYRTPKLKHHSMGKPSRPWSPKGRPLVVIGKPSSEQNSVPPILGRTKR
jgi:hypothetical protein